METYFTCKQLELPHLQQNCMKRELSISNAKLESSWAVSWQLSDFLTFSDFNLEVELIEYLRINNLTLTKGNNKIKLHMLNHVSI